MLVLTRKIGEKIVIGNEIVVQVLQVNGRGVRLGIEAPSHVPVIRQELVISSRPLVLPPSRTTLAHARRCQPL